MIILQKKRTSKHTKQSKSVVLQTLSARVAHFQSSSHPSVDLPTAVVPNYLISVHPSSLSSRVLLHSGLRGQREPIPTDTLDRLPGYRPHLKATTTSRTHTNGQFKGSNHPHIHVFGSHTDQGKACRLRRIPRLGI